jgi:hypothetical protein
MFCMRPIRSKTRLAAILMSFALLAGLAHGWLHAAHAASRHFADQNEFCALDKIAAVAPDAPAIVAPAQVADDDAVRPAAVAVKLVRPRQQPRAPPSA